MFSESNLLWQKKLYAHLWQNKIASKTLPAACTN